MRYEMQVPAFASFGKVFACNRLLKRHVLPSSCILIGLDEKPSYQGTRCGFDGKLRQ
jgi:hypothetical protein